VKPERCTATVDPADSHLRGPRRLWARGVQAFVRDAEVSANVVRQAIRSGDLDPLDLLRSAAWVCEKLKQHGLAADLRALAKERERR
jgi:hypothetical protein